MKKQLIITGIAACVGAVALGAVLGLDKLKKAAEEVEQEPVLTAVPTPTIRLPETMEILVNGKLYHAKRGESIRFNATDGALVITAP